MDTVFVESLTLQGKHGVSDDERLRAQPFIIDIAVDADTRSAAASDDISDTVNYVDCVAIAREIVEEHSFHLIEKIAELISARMLAHTRVAGVTVTVRKPAAVQDGIAGVTITRTRDKS